MCSQQDDMERRNLHVAPGWNELAVGTFCDSCGTRLVGDRGDAHPCPMGCEDES
jgi:hypothetical protein